MFLPLVKKLHLYTGLFTFTALVVYGMSGLIDSVLPPWSERQAPPTTEQYRRFAAPTGIGDKELADLVYAELDLPLTSPPADYSLSRLALAFEDGHGTYAVRSVEADDEILLGVPPRRSKPASPESWAC